MTVALQIALSRTAALAVAYPLSPKMMTFNRVRLRDAIPGRVVKTETREFSNFVQSLCYARLCVNTAVAAQLQSALPTDVSRVFS